MFFDRLELYSPGACPTAWSLDGLEMENTVTRNETIVNLPQPLLTNARRRKPDGQALDRAAVVKACPRFIKQRST